MCRTTLADETHGLAQKLANPIAALISIPTQANHDENIGPTDDWEVEEWSAPDTNTALIIEAINHIIDMHEFRLYAALYDRIPDTIWITLFVISALTMLTIGVQTGLTGSRKLVTVLPLALAFVALATVVVDLDHPQRGLLNVHQQAMIDLQNTMNRGVK